MAWPTSWGVTESPMAQSLGHPKNRGSTTAPGWSPVAYRPFLGCWVPTTTPPPSPCMDREGSQDRAELGAALEDPATPPGAGASMEPTPCGDLDHPWAGEKEEQNPEGDEPARVVSLLSSKQITGGPGRAPAAPSGPRAQRCAPKNARGATTMPQPGPPSPLVCGDGFGKGKPESG